MRALREDLLGRRAVRAARDLPLHGLRPERSVAWAYGRPLPFPVGELCGRQRSKASSRRERPLSGLCARGTDERGPPLYPATEALSCFLKGTSTSHFVSGGASVAFRGGVFPLPVASFFRPGRSSLSEAGVASSELPHPSRTPESAARSKAATRGSQMNFSLSVTVPCRRAHPVHGTALGSRSRAASTGRASRKAHDDVAVLQAREARIVLLVVEGPKAAVDVPGVRLVRPSASVAPDGGRRRCTASSAEALGRWRRASRGFR